MGLARRKDALKKNEWMCVANLLKKISAVGGVRSTNNVCGSERRGTPSTKEGKNSKKEGPGSFAVRKTTQKNLQLSGCKKGRHSVLLSGRSFEENEVKSPINLELKRIAADYINLQLFSRKEEP